MKTAMHSRRTSHRRRGVVLIAVLVLVALLSVILVEFAYESRLHLHIADNVYRSAQALDCANAGISIGAVLLQEYDEQEAEDRVHDLLNGATAVPVGDGACTLALEEESGKINVNLLTSPQGEIVRARADQLLRLIDLTNEGRGDSEHRGYSLVPSLMDWVDADDEATVLPFVESANEGAEQDYYERLPQPYACKNAPFDALEEIWLVKGMRRPALGLEGGPPARKAEPDVADMTGYLTVYGDGKININRASAMVLRTLSQEMDQDLAREIIERRDAQPFSRVDQLREIPGMTLRLYVSIRPLITAKPSSRFYRLTATGVAGDFVRRVQVVLRKAEGRVTVVLRREL